MKETYTIIATVGTSILSNYQKASRNNDWMSPFSYDLAYREKTAKEFDEDEEEKYRFQTNWFRGIQRKYLPNGQLQWEKGDKEIFNSYASAEIYTILEIIKHQSYSVYKIVLLTSDTYDSALSAYLIQAFFELYHQAQDNIVVYCTYRHVNDLRVFGVRNKEESFYNRAMSSLAGTVVKTLNKNNPKQVALCISGGYKAIIPLMTALAQAKGINLFYSFEDSKELIQFPAGILQLNWLLLEQLMYAGDLLNKINQRISKESHPELSALFDFLEDKRIIYWHRNKGKYLMNPWGSFIWELGETYRNQYNRKVFGYHIEAQIFSFLYDQLESRFYFHQGIYLTGNQGKQKKGSGDETDLLLISKQGQPKQRGNEISVPQTSYIIIESKSMWSFSQSKNQFKAKLRLLTTYWKEKAPSEIWIMLWCTQLSEQLTLDTLEKIKPKFMNHERMLQHPQWEGYFQQTKLRFFTHRYPIKIEKMIDYPQETEGNVKSFMRHSIHQVYLEQMGKASIPISDMEAWLDHEQF
ncbi:MAG: hypothetical protein ACPGJS_18805 [Flammeovirgaceae bacterium]